MLFIEYPRCSTCKKAKKFLEDNAISFTDRDIINQTPTEKELKEWLEKYSLTIDKLYNTSGLKYRELNLKENRKNMTIEEQLKLLASDGMLLKRPILITKNKMLTGFKETEWKKVIEEEEK